MSLHMFGTTSDTVGNVEKFVGQAVYVRLWVASAVAVQSAIGLCLRA